MKNIFNNLVHDFRYHAVVTIEENSLRKYLLDVYEEEEFPNIHSLADCVTSQYNELELNWPVRVYDKYSANRFFEEVYSSTWSRIAKEEYTQELKTLEDLSFAIYSDNRDELNECINHIAEHCWRHDINGHVSKIVFHVRPIEYGARDF